MDGNTAAVGIIGIDFGEGMASVYRRSGTGTWASAADLTDEGTELAAVTGRKVGCENGRAARFDCSGVDLVSFLPTKSLGAGRGAELNDLWGWTDPETGREYAIVGRFDGTAFVDVSDPENPIYLGELKPTDGSVHNFWRDMKVYKNHAFIVADGAANHGVQVFDLTQLRNVTNPPVEFHEVAHYDGIHSAHNIVIDEETGFAYAVGNSMGGETCGGGLHMINIQDPENPTFAGCFSHQGTGRAGTGYYHDAQCVIYHGPDKEHEGREICFGSAETALSIADVTDKQHPVALAAASYPNVGYAHQGWITEDHKYFLMDDELDEIAGGVDKTRTLIWDITDLDDPVLLKEYFGKTSSSDHNLYIKGNLVYESNYVSGLHILDITNIENPVEVGFFDTVPFGDNSAGFGGSWSNYPYFKSGIVVVTSGREGLFVLKKKDVNVVP